MSRNLNRIDCYFCQGTVALVGPIAAILKEQAGCYIDEYRGMMVADAICIECKAEYLAWVDSVPHNQYRKNMIERDHAQIPLFFDLSFRSTFNDEPGESDMPKWKVRRVETFVRTGPWETQLENAAAKGAK